MGWRDAREEVIGETEGRDAREEKRGRRLHTRDVNRAQEEARQRIHAEGELGERLRNASDGMSVPWDEMRTAVVFPPEFNIVGYYQPPMTPRIVSGLP